MITRSSLLTRTAQSTALLSAAALALTACGDDTDEPIPDDQETFTIGVSNEHEAHRELARIAEEEYGYDIELVNFTAYTEPNPALATGDLDANWFQHTAFLADHNAATGDDLQPIAATEIVPLTLYSQEHEDVSEYAEGDSIAIPNDQVNQGRAINVLVEAGLVELAEDVAQPEPQHVDEESSLVELEPVEAAQTVNALESADGSIINNNFAQDAELDPLEDGIFSDDPSDPSAFPYINYINAFVVREADVENEALQEIASIYHDERVLEIMDERSNGTSIPIDDVTGEQLRQAQEDYEDSLAEQDAEAEE